MKQKVKISCLVNGWMMKFPFETVPFGGHSFILRGNNLMSDFHPFLRIPGRDSNYQVSHKSTHELIMFSTILTYEFVIFFSNLLTWHVPKDFCLSGVLLEPAVEPRLDLGSDDEEARQKFASEFPVFNQLPWEPKTLIFSGYFTQLF